VGRGRGLDSAGLACGSVAGSCEHGKEPSGEELSASQERLCWWRYNSVCNA
jgi:hypothetical protein